MNTGLANLNISTTAGGGGLVLAGGGGLAVAPSVAVNVSGAGAVIQGAAGTGIAMMSVPNGEGGGGSNNGGVPNPGSMPYGGRQGALALRQMMRDMLQGARDLGENQLAGQIASQLERLEMDMLRHYPGLF